MTRALLVALLVVSAFCFSSKASASPSIPIEFHGTWEGTLQRTSLPSAEVKPEWTDAGRIRIVISKADVKVFTWNDDEWRQIKPKTFGITVFDTNAVISSITSGRDNDGVWVETWSFAVSIIDSQRLHALFQRQVNNKDLPRDDPDATWGTVAFGKLERVSNADV
jgi:hypothetical protein